MDKQYNKSRYERKRKYKNKQQQKRRRYGDDYDKGFGGNCGE
ncbi:hypothetical protein [Vibrio phage vB_VpP_BA6]|nr:hypothetical protein [Vibrio phage vB_VpP_BA6]